MVLVLGESRREEMVSMERVKPAKMLMVRSRVMMSEMMTEEVELLLSVDGGGMMMLGSWLMGAWWGEGFSDKEMRLKNWDRRSWESAEGAWMTMVNTSSRFWDFIS